MFLDVETDSLYTCGAFNFNFSGMIPNVVHTIVILIKIVVPILLVIFGSIDFLKAVIAQKDDEIKKGQQTFMKRLIAAIIVFFVVQLVQLLISFASNDDSDIVNCFDCFVNADNCKDPIYSSSKTGGV